MGVLVVVVWTGSEREREVVRGGGGKKRRRKGKRKKRKGREKRTMERVAKRKAEREERREGDEGTRTRIIIPQFLPFVCNLSRSRWLFSHHPLSLTSLSIVLLPFSSASLSLLGSSRNPSQPPRAVLPGEGEKRQERKKQGKKVKGQGGQNICHLALAESHWHIVIHTARTNNPNQQAKPHFFFSQLCHACLQGKGTGDPCMYDRPPKEKLNWRHLIRTRSQSR